MALFDNDSAEMQNLGLVKKLAHNEKHERDEAVETLNTFLCGKRAEEYEDQEDGQLLLDFLKLWKGLFYGMWMSDKVQIQRELALALAKLVHCFRESSLFLAWCESLFLTFQREWYRLDKYRIDKYYTLIRFAFNCMFEYMKRFNWDKTIISEFVNLLKRDVIQQRKAIGFKFHVTDLYLEELCKVAGETIENDAFIQLINPFLFEFGNSTDKGWQRRIKSSLFDKMIEDVQFKEYFNKKTNDSDDSTMDDTDGNETDLLVFHKISLVIVADLIWKLASTDESSRSSCRPHLYEYHKNIKKKIKQYGVGYIVTMPIATSNDMNSQWKDVNTNTTTNDDDRKQKKSKKRRIKELNDKTDVETNGDDNNKNKTGVSSKGSAINGNHTYGNDGKQNDVKKQVDSSKLFDDVVATTTTTVGKKKNKKRRKKRKKIVEEEETLLPSNNNSNQKNKASHSRRVSFSPTNRQKNYKHSVRDLRKKKRIGRSAHRPATSGILRILKGQQGGV